MTQYKIGANQASSVLGDETVILNHKRGHYYGLNDTGSFIWNLLYEKPRSFDELKAGIMAKFEIDEQTCIEDLNELLDSLLHESLIEKD